MGAYGLYGLNERIRCKYPVLELSKKRWGVDLSALSLPSLPLGDEVDEVGFEPPTLRQLEHCKYQIIIC